MPPTAAGASRPRRITPRSVDYIDAQQWNATTNLASTTLVTNQFSVLKYVNQSARIYGLDLSGHMPLAKMPWVTSASRAC
jgi:hypothetical protein